MLREGDGQERKREALIPSYGGVYPREEFGHAFVIGLGGFSGVGKTTVAEAILKELAEQTPALAGRRLSLADRIKRVLAVLVDENLAFDRQSEKRLPLYAGSDWQAGDFLRIFGTEFVRDNIGEDFWIDVAAKQLARLEEPTVIVIDSLRYGNDARFIRALGIAVLLERDDVVQTIDHVSEAPEELSVDAVVKNNGTPRETARAVLALARADEHWFENRPPRPPTAKKMAPKPGR